MQFDPLESAKFAQAADEGMEKLADGVSKVLAENAGRGFPMPAGPTLETILNATQAAKGALVEANGKIYDERRGLIFQQTEFLMGVVVKLAKLSMELYREELMNALIVEAAQADQLRDQGRADVDRMNAETEKRQVAIIRDKAEVERRIIVYKHQLVDIQEKTLPLEEALINAQLATATKKLEIIDSIYKVLAAEELVLKAEQRRADALSKVVEAKLIVAGIKKEMIPFYLQKAEARETLAQAIIAEIPILKAIEELGYDRIALKTAEEDSVHIQHLAEEEFEMAREALLRATKATELARAQSRRLLIEYSNHIRALILEQKKELEENNIEFKLDTQLARQRIGINNDVAVTTNERQIVIEEMYNLLNNMEARAEDQDATVRDGAFTKTSISQLNASITRRIRGG